MLAAPCSLSRRVARLIYTIYEGRIYRVALIYQSLPYICMKACGPSLLVCLDVSAVAPYVLLNQTAEAYSVQQEGPTYLLK